MTASCNDLERALAGEDPALLSAFEAHAASCPSCGRELSEWRRISGAARQMRRAWDSPDLLPRIRQALAEASTRPTEAPEPPVRRFAWVPAASIAALFLIATAGLVVFRNSGGREPLSEHWKTTKAPLLTEAAIDEVDRAEQAYLASIDRLSKLAEPALSNATSPVMVNYREKLTVLDSAIAELKASVDQNRGNTHLRRELLAVYQEKQRTLQDLMKEVKS